MGNCCYFTRNQQNKTQLKYQEKKEIKKQHKLKNNNNGHISTIKKFLSQYNQSEPIQSKLAEKSFAKFSSFKKFQSNNTQDLTINQKSIQQQNKQNNNDQPNKSLQKLRNNPFKNNLGQPEITCDQLNITTYDQTYKQETNEVNKKSNVPCIQNQHLKKDVKNKSYEPENQKDYVKENSKMQKNTKKDQNQNPKIQKNYKRKNNNIKFKKYILQNSSNISQQSCNSQQINKSNQVTLTHLCNCLNRKTFECCQYLCTCYIAKDEQCKIGVCCLQCIQLKEQIKPCILQENGSILNNVSLSVRQRDIDERQNNQKKFINQIMCKIKMSDNRSTDQKNSQNQQTSSIQINQIAQQNTQKQNNANNPMQVKLQQHQKQKDNSKQKQRLNITKERRKIDKNKIKFCSCRNNRCLQNRCSCHYKGKLCNDQCNCVSCLNLSKEHRNYSNAKKKPTLSYWKNLSPDIQKIDINDFKLEHNIDVESQSKQISEKQIQTTEQKPKSSKIIQGNIDQTQLVFMDIQLFTPELINIQQIWNEQIEKVEGSHQIYNQQENNQNIQ